MVKKLKKKSKTSKKRIVSRSKRISAKTTKKTVMKTQNKPRRKVKKLKNSYPKLRTSEDIAMDFATKVHKKFNHIVKATILFGSQTKGTVQPGSDIDIVFCHMPEKTATVIRPQRN